MCGICGVVGRADRVLIEGMLERLAHRGPDDQGIFIRETSNAELVGLGHRRLSIIDLSAAGHEPMSDAEGRVWLTYNGEIYNFRELRAELESLGYGFKSDTDAEVIIYSYIEWGTASLTRLNGMFAFALWDARDESLLLAVDRLGIKPLYYTDTKAGFAFASEIKAFLAIPEFERSVDPESLDQFLTFLWTPHPKTLFRGVHKLEPGHYLLRREGRIEVRQYWDVSFVEDESLSENEWVERLRGQIARSVKSQMISDVPLGAFLSGGLDSSSVVALMSSGSSNNGHKVSTYTFGFRDQDLRYDIIGDDIKYARTVGRAFKTDYEEEFLDPRVVELLPQIVYHLDEPIADPAIITSYLICRSARQRLTVLLSGMGGDEVFAGYPRHLAVRVAAAYNLIPGFVSHPIVAALPGAKPGRFTSLFRNMKKLAKSASAPERERYLGFSTYFTPAEKGELYTGDLGSSINAFDPYAAHRRYFDKVADQDFINQMLYVDLKTYLPCLNLAYTDKTSMASSVEVRVPLLDHELVEMAARIPARLKIKRLTRKYIFKRAAEAWLPREIIYRKKAGFSAPIRAWLLDDMKDMVDDLLSEPTIRSRGYFNHSTVRTIIDDQRSGREDNALKIFQLLMLELWHRAFIDKQ